MRLLTIAALLALAACAAPEAIAPQGSPAAGEPVATPRPPLVLPIQRPVFWVEAPIPGDPSPIEAKVPLTGARLEGDLVRLVRPPIAETPRRVAIQAGHLDAAEMPDEQDHLRFSFGASMDGVSEVEVTLDIAERVAAILRARGIVVDLLPATVPPSYLADAFVSLHADGDVTRTARGFRIAHGFYRSPYDATLVDHLIDRYEVGTGLPRNDVITSDMTDYYAFGWFRYEHALAPHTPAAIIEMGFLSHPLDRSALLEEPDRVATAIAEGVIAFLDAVPRSALFGQDILVPTVPAPHDQP